MSLSLSLNPSILSQDLFHAHLLSPSPIPLMLTEELSSSCPSPLSPGPSLPESTSKFANPPIVYLRRCRPSSPVAADPTPDVSTPDSLPSSSTVFSQALAALTVPKSVDEALKDHHWLRAMQEWRHLKENMPGTVGPLPAGKHPIGCRWVYSIKFYSHGAVDICKARIVAKGYSQIEDVDFHETFSLVAKINSVRILISLAAHFDWELFQLDVKNAICIISALCSNLLGLLLRESQIMFVFLTSPYMV